MAYRTHNDKETEWHEFVNTQITRNLDCSIEKKEVGMFIRLKDDNK